MGNLPGAQRELIATGTTDTAPRTHCKRAAVPAFGRLREYAVPTAGA